MKVLYLGARFVPGAREENVHVHSGRVAGEGWLRIVRFGILCAKRRQCCDFNNRVKFVGEASKTREIDLHVSERIVNISESPACHRHKRDSRNQDHSYWFGKSHLCPAFLRPILLLQALPRHNGTLVHRIASRVTSLVIFSCPRVTVTVTFSPSE
jgi:hypothetical protein